MWQSPWDNAVAGGDQITQAMWAMATGGGFGTGLGLGDSRYLPAGHTDLDPRGGRRGAWRRRAGGRRSAVSRSSPGAASASADGVERLRILSGDGADAVPDPCRSLIMASGVLGVTPLTGVVTPFLSYGGSAMLANFAALGILAADPRGHAGRPVTSRRFACRCDGSAPCSRVCARRTRRGRRQRPGRARRRPRRQAASRHPGRRRAPVRVQPAHPRRRLAQIPRGTIYDRRGLPLATDDAQRARRRAPGVCSDSASRSPTPVPIADRALLSARRPRLPPPRRRDGRASTGPHRTRRTSSATRRDRLRGFDDHAADRQDNRRGRSMRRIPSPRLPRPRAVAAASIRAGPPGGRRRSGAATRCAPDARRAPSASRRGDRRRATPARRTGRAAAVVLDPDTGAVLASVSYPWPAPVGWRRPRATERGDAAARSRTLRRSILRARRSSSWLPLAALGAEPGVGGSDVHLRTAAGRPHRRAVMPGWTRPVRDDVLDTHPHGTIDMHEGARPFVQRVLRPARDQARPGAARGMAGAARHPARRRDPAGRAAGARHAPAGRLRAGRGGGLALAHGHASRRRLRPMASFTSRTRREPGASCGPTDSWTRRRRGALGELHARRRADRYRAQPAGHPGRSRARPARRKCRTRPRTAGSSGLRRTVPRRSGSPSQSSSSTRDTAVRPRRRRPAKSSPRPQRRG